MTTSSLQRFIQSLQEQIAEDEIELALGRLGLT